MKVAEAKGLLLRADIKLTECNPEASFFIFKFNINGSEFIVSQNQKGWTCGYVNNEKYKDDLLQARENGWKTPIKWGCVMNKNKEDCEHVLACKLLLNSKDIRELVQSNTSLKEACRLGRLRVLHQPEINNKQGGMKDGKINI